MTGRIIRGPAAQAEFDQAQAHALENIRGARGFLLVTTTADENGDFDITSVCAGKNVLDATAVLMHAPGAADDYMDELIQSLTDTQEDQAA